MKSGKFSSLDSAITAEFATLPKYTRKYVYIDADSPLMVEATKHISAKVLTFAKSDIPKYVVFPDSADFTAGTTTFHFAQAQPRDLSIQLLMLKSLANYLKIPLRTDFSTMPVPPGRSSYFRGINNLEIIDSSYNAHIISMQSVLEMARVLRSDHKWLIIGDIVDQGSIEAEEHRRLADLIASVQPEEIVLIGRRTKAYTAPRLKELGFSPKTTLDPHKALSYIKNHTRGGETLIFKGSQYLEWIIEKLLADPADAALLCRRDPLAVKRRQKRGLD